MERLTILPSDWLVLPWAALMLGLALVLLGALPPN